MDKLCWSRPDFLDRFASELLAPECLPWKAERDAVIGHERWQKVASLLSQLPIVSSTTDAANELPKSEVYSSYPTTNLSMMGAVVKAGKPELLNSAQDQVLRQLITNLIPWRKGPFSVCGRYIDAEWRSNLKWDRLLDHLPLSENQRVIDVGCSNGYYLWRCRELGNPEVILGLDPLEQCFWIFELMQRFIQDQRVHLVLGDSSHLDAIGPFFDLALCLGVIYHVREPLSLLKGLWACLKPGGVLVLESQCIPGQGSTALFPEGRYAKARNVYFVPTVECLANWVKRSGFQDVQIIAVSELTPEEQRQTEFSPYESLSAFLDPQDSQRTVEGYPAPLRAAVKARKPLGPNFSI